MKSTKIFHRRNLPHFQPQGATFFVTYLLHGGMPAPLLEKLNKRKEFRSAKGGIIPTQEQSDKENIRYFKKFDNWLDKIPNPVYC